jgi:hypothetical protein
MTHVNPQSVADGLQKLYLIDNDGQRLCSWATILQLTDRSHATWVRAEDADEQGK